MNSIKARSLRYSLTCLAATVLGIFWFGCSAKGQENIQVFTATVKRDCAPWDGSAFTVSIPYDPDFVIDISIWQSPDIRGPIRFSFPDRTRSVGSALLRRQAGLPEELTGNVYLRSVGQGVPVEGGFNLTAATGRQFEGNFLAVWENEIVYCG